MRRAIGRPIQFGTSSLGLAEQGGRMELTSCGPFFPLIWFYFWSINGEWMKASGGHKALSLPIVLAIVAQSDVRLLDLLPQQKEREFMLTLNATLQFTTP